MDIQELKLFSHLAGTLNYSKTSRTCNITPSGLTRTIQRLENELGKPLFHRNKRSVKLTKEGEIFWSYAQQSLQLWNQLLSDLNRNGSLSGELKIFCSVTAILSILPDIIERFRSLHPGVHIKLQTGDAAMALSLLENGETDISIAAKPDKLQDHLEFLQIIETPLIFVAARRPHNGILYLKDQIEIDWNRTPLILAERGLSRKRTETWLKKKEITPTIYAHVAGNEAILSLVAMGCGVGVIPELVLLKSPLRNQIQVLEIAPPLIPFCVGACTTLRNKRNPIVKAFWQNVKEGTAHTQTL